jgi:hypothetical protein
MRNETKPQRRGSFGTKGFYISYIERLIQRREAAGKPLAPDVAPEEYWNERREREAEKQLPLKKAA